MVGSYQSPGLTARTNTLNRRREDTRLLPRPETAWPAEIGPIRRAYAARARRQNRLRAACRLAGTILIVLGSLGLVLLAAGPVYQAAADLLAPSTSRPASAPARVDAVRPAVYDYLDPTLAPPRPRATPAAGTAVTVPRVPEDLPITELSVPSIGLVTRVVPAPLINRGGQLTWEVPPFVVGHAEGTAGAGAPGNAVLMGHITSRNLGNVFINLGKVQVGDMLAIFSGDRQFDYRVVEVKVVPRTDVSVVGPTDKPTVTLITCTGTWLPLISDYSHRLIVRAERVGP